MKTSLFLLTLPFLATSALAQTESPPPTPDPAVAAVPITEPETNDEQVIVITAERRQQTLLQSPSSVAVVTRAQIEARKSFDLVDAIRLLPGVSVSQSGTFGKSASIFLRGTNSNHTLVLVDGVRANSPQDGRFDIGQIPIENVEQIEIVRGPASALYGSDAIGGVINIITRRGQGPIRTGGQLEYGSFATQKQVVTVSGASDKNRVSFSAFRNKTDGNFQNDDFRDLGASLRFDRAIGGNANLVFIGRTSSAKFGVPGQRFLSFDPNQRGTSRDSTVSLAYTNQVGKRNDRVTVGLYDRHLTDDDTRATTSPAPNPSRFSNQVLSLDAQTGYRFNQNTVIGGLELRRESADIFSSSSFGESAYDRSTRTYALFAQDEYRSGDFALVPGVRYENNSQFGDFTSYRLAGAYNVNPATKIKASFGTAFKAPPFDSLYFPNFGNPNLVPERSRGFDLGVRRELNKRGGVELTYFNNRIRNLIGSDPTTFLPININSARTSGAELSYDQEFGGGLRFITSGTYTHTRSTSGPLLRRPKFNLSSDLVYQRGPYDLDLSVLVQGRRFDADFINEFTAREYGGFARVDFAFGYRLKNGVQPYIRINNLLNRNYQEVAGYPAPRFNVVFGVHAF